MDKNIVPDYGAACAFLNQLELTESLFQSYPTRENPESTALPTNKIGTIESLWPWIQSVVGQRGSISAAVNPCKGAKQSDVLSIGVIWADDDIPRDGHRTDWPIEPHAINETSQGKYHYFWRVAQGALEPKEAGKLQALIAERYGTDASLKDFSKKARLPGTINWKRSEPWLVRTIQSNSREPYTRVELKEAFGDWSELQTKPRRSCDNASGVVGEGGRNDFLFRQASKLRGLGFNEEQILEQISESNQRQCKPPLAEDEVGRIVESAAQFEPNPGPDLMSDLYVAGRFKAFCEEKRNPIRFVGSTGLFLVWQGRWMEDSTGEILLELWRDFQRQEVMNAAEQVGREGAKALLNKAASLGDSRKIDAVFKVLKRLPGVPANLNEFDAEPFKLQAPRKGGGFVIIDLKTGKARQVVPSDMCLRIAGAEFDPDAICSNFEETLLKACCGDTELASYLQKWAGYFAVGYNHAEELPIWCGGGANIKSTIREVLREALGSYAAVALPSILLARDSGAPTNDLARLVGVRLVCCSETEDGAKLADGMVKYITSNETISARFLHREFFEFKPQFKILLCTNHKPVTRATDNGLWRRLSLVPFRFTVPEEDRVPDFRQRMLLPELSGVLNWVIQGAIKFNQEGLKKPKVVADAVAEYREESDLFAQWREDCSIIAEGGFEFTSELWRSFCAWHEDSLGALPRGLTVRTMTKALRDAGFSDDRTRRGRGFRGLTIKPKQLGLKVA